MRRRGWRGGAQAILTSGALAVAGAVGCTAGPGAARVAGESWLITTIAGGPGGRATTINSPVPCAMTATTGTLYLAGGPPTGGIASEGDYAVTKVAEATGTLADVAGFGPSAGGFTPDGSPALTARFFNPCALAVDRHQNLVLADGDGVDNEGEEGSSIVGNARVRVIAARDGTWYGQQMRAGRIYTIAGTGTRGLAGDGGPAVRARLRHPGAVAVDPYGNVVIADVRLYTDLWSDPVWALAKHSGILAGQRVRAGSFTQIAGLPATTAATTGPMGLPVISSGSGPGPRDGDLAGLPAVWAGRFVPATLANHRVVITAPGTGTWFGRPMLAGHAYAIAGDGTFWEGQHIDGALATAVPLPSSVDMTPVVDRAGNVLLADPFGGKVWAVAARSGVFYGRPMTAGRIYTIVVGPDVHHEAGVRFGACHGWMTPIITDAAGNLVIGCGQSGLVVLATRSGRRGHGSSRCKTSPSGPVTEYWSTTAAGCALSTRRETAAARTERTASKHHHWTDSAVDEPGLSSANGDRCRVRSVMRTRPSITVTLPPGSPASPPALVQVNAPAL